MGVPIHHWRLEIHERRLGPIHCDFSGVSQAPQNLQYLHIDKEIRGADN